MQEKVETEWHEMTLGECVIINDSTYSPKEAWPFVNYLDTGNITENRIADVQHLVAGRDKMPSRARRKVQPGDIVYSTVRPNQKHFGMIENVPENFLVSTGFAVMRAKESLADTDFLYWFLTQGHIVEHLHSIAENSTSAYPSIRPSDIGQLTLLLPSLAEQRAIAAVLDSMDEAIERTESVIAATEQLRDALLHELLTRGVPGRHTEWKEAPGVGTIPADWEAVRLGDVAEVKGGVGFPLERQGRRAGTYPFIKVSDMTLAGNETHIRTANNYVGQEDADGLGANVFMPGTVVFPKVGAAIGTNKKRLLTVPTIIDNNLVGVTASDSGSCDVGFLRRWFESIDLSQFANVSAVPSITGSRLMRELIPLPPLAEQRAIAAVLDGADEAIERARAECDALRELRTSAADALLTGRVRVERSILP